MKNPSFLTLCAIILVVAASNLSGESDLPSLARVIDLNLASSPWYTQYVHFQASPTPIDVGDYASIAFNPVDGLPYISYYNRTNQDLMLASPQPLNQGNCGDNNDWWCRAVDGDGLEGRSTDDTGQFSSIAFWKGPSENVWKLGISYFDATTYSLRYAAWLQQGYSGAWTYEDVSEGSSTNQYGWHTSLKFDSSGNAHIASYNNNSLGGDSLLYAYSLGDGTGNCGTADNWWCSVVDTGKGAGKWPSLDLRYDDAENISYWHEGLKALRYAYYAGIGNCGTDYAWSCQTIDDSGMVGGYSSLQAPGFPGDPLRVAYFDFDQDSLKYAESGKGSSNGNCGPNLSWDCRYVDDMNPTLPVGISMKVDPQGLPMIAYQYKNPDNPTGWIQLRIARPYTAYFNLPHGNCGEIPPGFDEPIWQCTILDLGGYYQVTGNYISLAINPGGLAAIAYSEDDNYFNATGLKIAYQRARTFLPILIR